VIKRVSSHEAKTPRQRLLAAEANTNWPTIKFPQKKSGYSFLYAEIFAQLCIAVDDQENHSASKKSD
jgi:hypothetical protein